MIICRVVGYTPFLCTTISCMVVCCTCILPYVYNQSFIITSSTSHLHVQLLIVWLYTTCTNTIISCMVVGCTPSLCLHVQQWERPGRAQSHQPGHGTSGVQWRISGPSKGNSSTPGSTLGSLITWFHSTQT